MSKPAKQSHCLPLPAVDLPALKAQFLQCLGRLTASAINLREICLHLIIDYGLSL